MLVDGENQKIFTKASEIHKKFNTFSKLIKRQETHKLRDQYLKKEKIVEASQKNNQDLRARVKEIQELIELKKREDAEERDEI